MWGGSVGAIPVYVYTGFVYSETNFVSITHENSLMDKIILLDRPPALLQILHGWSMSWKSRDEFRTSLQGRGSFLRHMNSWHFLDFSWSGESQYTVAIMQILCATQPYLWSVNSLRWQTYSYKLLGCRIRTGRVNKAKAERGLAQILWVVCWFCSKLGVVLPRLRNWKYTVKYSLSLVKLEADWLPDSQQSHEYYGTTE